MDWWDALLLGLVEGLSEYLPISSTGHLILTQRALGIAENEASNAYAICIQAGAILAVLGIFWKSVQNIVVGFAGKLNVGPGHADGFSLGVHILLAFVPAAILGVLFDDWIESKLFGLWPIVAAWGLGGVALLLLPKDTGDQGGTLQNLRWKSAIGIGTMQCLAMWPGTSRSLVTIVGGLLFGLSMAAAVEFSFLLGLLTLCAATVYKAKSAGPIMIATYGWGPMLLGSAAAWLFAHLAVRWMLSYLQKHSMSIFGYYRIVLAISVATLLFLTLLHP